jgi:hypothetical protein
LTIEMSDGSTFRGTLQFSTTLLKKEFLTVSTLVLSRALTSADDGTGTWTVTAVPADGSQSASIQIAFTIAAPVEGPPVFSGWPTTVMMADNAPAGTVVASGTLTDAGGTAFTGSVSMVDQNGNSAPLTFVA